MLIALAVLSCVPITRGSSPHIPRKSQLPILSALPVFADLDGDYAPDSVKLLSDGLEKTIDIQFANLRTSRFSFASESVESGRLIAGDINGDGHVDLIWAAGRDLKTAVILLNNGKGDLTQARDNSPYTDQLKALLSAGDPSDQHSVQARRSSIGLTSPSFSDIALTPTNRFASPTLYLDRIIEFNGFNDRSAFLSYLHKRGPPLVFS